MQFANVFTCNAAEDKTGWDSNIASLKWFADVCIPKEIIIVKGYVKAFRSKALFDQLSLKAL